MRIVWLRVGISLQMQAARRGEMPTWSVPQPSPMTCEHCWCQSTTVYPTTQQPISYQGVPHEVCCMCQTRRVRQEAR